MKPDWKRIIEIAAEAGRRLGKPKKPGQLHAHFYRSTLQKAQALGHRGTDREREIFVRRQG